MASMVLDRMIARSLRPILRITLPTYRRASQARAGNLPPGLGKQLERKRNVAARPAEAVAALSVEIERQLLPLAPDYRRGFIGVHLVVFNRNTGIIVDVLTTCTERVFSLSDTHSCLSLFFAHRRISAPSRQESFGSGR